MEVIIVDNGSRYIKKLKVLLKKYRPTVVDYRKVKNHELHKFDLVVLSGGHGFSVASNKNRFRKEVLFIRKRKKPLLGICLGFELIASAFGAKLERMVAKKKGIIRLRIAPASIPGVHDATVYESHRWIVKKLPKTLKAIARSKDGVEAFAHRTRPIYGFQFHPEMFVRKTDGKKIFDISLAKIAGTNNLII
jgi:GMP synthase-like glutamine amidotransferase